MRKVSALAAVLLLLSVAPAASQECSIAVGSSTLSVGFADSGGDTATQTGSLVLLCTEGTAPTVSVTGGTGSGPDYDFSGNLEMGVNLIPFTGKWTAQPVGAGTSVPVSWTFTTTATGLHSAKPGTYTAALTLTVTP